MESIISKSKYEDLILQLIKRDFDFEKERVPGIFKKIEYRNLPNGKKEVFTKIYNLRDKIAQEYDLPPNSLLSNESMFNLVNGRESPESAAGPGKRNSIPEKAKNEIANGLKTLLG
jgi:ribonuclease D